MPMGLTGGNAPTQTISSVGVANPGRITSVGNATPGSITGVDVAHPGTLGGVGSVPAIVPPPVAPVKVVVPAAPAPVYAPKLDIAAVNAQARADAANAVNPYYTQQLNQFLTQQSQLQQQQQAQAQTNIKNAQDTLAETQKNNTLTGERTTADTALKTSQINTAQDQNQQDTGTSFEDARLAMAKQQATNGILGSGAGNRATNTAIIQRNTTEGRQNTQFQEQKDAAALDKARTFEDLANSNDLATKTEGKTESQVNFDLGNYIQNLGYQSQQQRDALDKARQNEIDATAKQLSQTAYANYLNNISDPATRVVAAQTYSGAF